MTAGGRQGNRDFDQDELVLEGLDLVVESVVVGRMEKGVPSCGED
jgi:hypothetical protein